MRVRLLSGVIAIALVTCSVALAQDYDFLATGQSMEDAANRGDWTAAFTSAKQILDAAPDDLSTLTAEEQYWVGIAHMYSMAMVLDMAKDGLQDEEQAAYATSVSEWVMNPYEEVVVIGHGETVNLSEHLVPGKTVIVDFYSQYCPPCMQIGPMVEALVKQRDDLVLVKVDINRPDVQGIDWQSPVARQFNLHGIPYFQVYGPDGAQIAEGQQARTMVVDWLQEMGG